MTVEQLQRKDSSERGKTENAQMMLINSIEKKYKDQIKDLNENHAQIISDWRLRHKQLEKDYKELHEKYEIETRGKMSEYGSMEKKIRELLENEQQYLEEIKDLKNQRDKKCLENQAVLEREKEIYKHRLAELESKLKNSDSKRSFQIFEIEKERAKWMLEKDKLIQDKDVIKDQYRKLKEKKEKLEKELNKIKNDFREHRKFMYSGTISSGSAAKELASEKVKTIKTKSSLDSSSDYRPSMRSYKKTKYSTKNYIGDK